MLGGIAAQSILYSSDSNPNELTGDVDLEFAAKNKASLKSDQIVHVYWLIRSSYPRYSPLFTCPMDVSRE